MPKKVTLDLPDNVTIEIVGGGALIKARQAAKLAGLHPVILEMGERLLKKPGEELGRFKLGTPELRERAAAIQQAFVKGLRRVASAFSDAPLHVKTAVQDGALVFWYERVKAKA